MKSLNLFIFFLFLSSCTSRTHSIYDYYLVNDSTKEVNRLLNYSSDFIFSNTDPTIQFYVPTNRKNALDLEVVVEDSLRFQIRNILGKIKISYKNNQEEKALLNYCKQKEITLNQFKFNIKSIIKTQFQNGIISISPTRVGYILETAYSDTTLSSTLYSDNFKYKIQEKIKKRLKASGAFTYCFLLIDKNHRGTNQEDIYSNFYDLTRVNDSLYYLRRVVDTRVLDL